MKSLLLLPALCLLTASPAWGQSKLSPSLRQQLASQPTARTAATPQVLPVFIHVSHSGMADSLRARGVRVGTCTHSWLTAYVPSHSLPAVAAFAEVVSSSSVMMWDKPSYDGIIATATAVVQRVPVFHLKCLPDAAAARLCRDTIAAAYGR